MRIDDLINALTNICQLVDGWTAGGCICGAPVPWSPWDEETRQRCHGLLAAAYAHKEGRAELVVEKFTCTQQANDGGSLNG